MNRPAKELPPLGSLDAEYGPLVALGRKHGLGKTRCFELARSGMLRTCLVGKRRMVYLESLRTLPERLGANGGAE